jgi:hypothetical protein
MLSLAEALEISNMTWGRLITDSRLLHNKQRIVSAVPAALDMAEPTAQQSFPGKNVFSMKLTRMMWQ